MFLCCFARLVATCSSHYFLVAMLCGGTTEAVVDERVKEVAMKMKGEVEKHANESFSTFEPVEAMTQVVGVSAFL